MALVEFALVVPLLALLAFGTVDLGRAYSLKNQLKNAAREGAAYAQFNPLQQGTSGTCANPDNIRYHAQQELDGASGYLITVNPSTSCNVATTSLEPGDTVRVTAQSDFSVITPFIGAIVGSPLTIRESVETVIQG